MGRRTHKTILSGEITPVDIDPTANIDINGCDNASACCRDCRLTARFCLSMACR